MPFSLSPTDRTHRRKKVIDGRTSGPYRPMADGDPFGEERI